MFGNGACSGPKLLLRLTSLGNFLRGLHVRTIVLACFPEGGKDRYVLNIFYGVF